jgi:phosphoribosyl-AMP cyclohydrolase / phosphoribosyl-ATP pyrophosphohydrolase
MKLNFNKLEGLIPAIIQDNNTNQVLMLGFMNREAFEKSKETGLVTFFSRTRKRQWIKGEESGNFLKIIEMIPDCDSDTLLVKVVPSGPVCHTGADTCFNESGFPDYSFLIKLQELIHKRKVEMPADSYTTKLFEKGMNKIAQKVGEEAVELVIEAMDSNDDLLLNEAADLLYHLLVLLSAKEKDIRDVIEILKSRHNK